MAQKYVPVPLRGWCEPERANAANTASSPSL